MARKKKAKKAEPKNREWIITQALLQGWLIFHKAGGIENRAVYAYQVSPTTFKVHLGDTGGVLNLSDAIGMLESYDDLNNWSWDESAKHRTRTIETKVIEMEVSAGKGRRGKRG